MRRGDRGRDSSARGGSRSQLQGEENSSLSIEFRSASDFMSKANSISVSVPRRLDLYKFYKQATEGPCNRSRPPLHDQTGRTKWDSWKSLGAMSSAEAQANYVRLVDELAPDWRERYNQTAATSEDNSSRPQQSRFGMGKITSTLAGAMRDEESGDEDLFVACGRGQLEKVLELLDAGADVNERNEYMETPLHMAADRGHAAVIDTLLRYGADINAQDEGGQTPLMFAVINEKSDAIVQLVQAGADPNIEDEAGVTPLTAGSAELAAMITRALQQQASE